MNIYDEECYIAHEPSGEDHIFPEVDDKTAARKYSYKKITLGGPPFFFYNYLKKRNKKKNIKRSLTDVLFDGTNLIVSDLIYR